MVTLAPPSGEETPKTGVDWSKVEWNEDQARALEQVQAWYRGGKQVFRIGGLAGTGKTLLSSYLSELLQHPMTFCAPTGRAASVLSDKNPGITARTVHSLLRYGPSGSEHDEDCPGDSRCICEANGEFVKLQDTSGAATGQLILVDEASMVTSRMWAELLAMDCRVIAVGDHGQLPPIGDTGFSVVSEGSLDVKLSKIVRQAEGNPIIRLAHEVRDGTRWPVGSTGAVTVLRKPLSTVKIGYTPNRPVLCATNRQRVLRNKEIRARRGFPRDEVVPGDVIVCLRNNHGQNVFNGERGVVTAVEPARDPNLVYIYVDMENGRKYQGHAIKAQFNAQKPLMTPTGDPWDFGYAMSVHKFQGSESDEVLLLAENIGWLPKDDQIRWKYTGITRAAKALTVVVPG